MIKCLTIIVFVFSCLGTIQTYAQDSAAAKHKWNVLAEPYLMFPNLKGTTGVGTLPDAEVDADAGKVFSHLKLGAMLFIEVVNDRWALSSDILYMKLAQDAKSGTLINSGKITVKQFAWELSGLRKLMSWLETGVGLRLNSLNTDLDLVTNNIGGSTTTRSKSVTATWVDPIVIARIKSDAGKKFIYQFRGDIGGFGIGADLAWQIQTYVGYRFSKLFQLTGGYRIISIDYNKGTGEERFFI
jgi:hypothetical protein